MSRPHLSKQVRNEIRARKREQLIFPSPNKLTTGGALKKPFNVWRRLVGVHGEDLSGEVSVPHPVRLEVVDQTVASRAFQPSKKVA